MYFSDSIRRYAVSSLICLAMIPVANAQIAAGSVSDANLQDPAASDWLMWRRSYNSFGYSPLAEINRDNVADLRLAWDLQLSPGPNMTTPLVHDGVMYLLSTRDLVLALDARSGEELWRYEHPLEGFSNAKMGMALHGDKVIVPTSDMHIVALNNKTGDVIWDHQVDATSTGPIPYSLRGAPIIAGGKVIQGVTATLVPEGGLILGIDLATGEESWRFHTIARPDAPGGETWNNLSLPKRSGGSVWVAGSYVPELDLVYFGAAPTYDTAPLLPDLDIDGVNNDALYTNSTIALRPETGELVWHYQHVANDQWDLDWIYERTIVDLEVDGEMRKVILTAGKMALFDAIDAQTGEYLFSIDVGLQNVITAIDPVTGAKTIDPASMPNAERSHLVCPFANGGRNWQASAYNPDTGMLYLPLAEVCMDGGPTGGNSILTTGAAMNPRPLPGTDGKSGRLQAINLKTRELDWTFREIVPPTSAVITTGSNLVFGGALDGSFKAFDGTTGEVLWRTELGDIPASFPITYSVDGKQFIAIVIGQPSIHANVFLGAVNAFVGEGENPIANMARNGAALKVYAL